MVLKKLNRMTIISFLFISACLVLILSINVSQAAAASDASFVRTEVPDEMLAGHRYAVALTAQNTGTGNWTAAANFRLASLGTNQFAWSQWKEGGYSNSVSDNRAHLPGYANVGTNNAQFFNFSVTAPTTVGSYSFAAQMVQDGLAFFGQQYLKSIAVKNIVVDGLPKKLKANTSYRVTVSVLNKGANTWTSAGNYKLTRLDTSFPWSNWLNGGTATTANLNASDSIITNEGTSFSFTITTPAAAGSYSFSAQVKSGATGYSDTYTRTFTVDTDSRVYSYEGETFFTNKVGTKATDTASGGSYGYTAGAGNTPMWKAEAAYTAYAAVAGEYNVYLKVNSSQTVPIRIQMYGGPSDGISVDFTPTDINSWQWVGPLKVSLVPGYANYKLTAWKLGGGAADFLGVDQVYIVSTDTDNAFAKKLQIDEKTLSYIVPNTTSTGINVNANANIPVFYKMVGTGDSLIQLSNKTTNDNYATLRDTLVPGVIRIKVDYLGTASGIAQFRFTNLSDSHDGKAGDTILKANGYGRIAFDHGSFFNPSFLDSDLLPGQSVIRTFNAGWLMSGSNYVVKVIQQVDGTNLIGTFTVAPANVNASTILGNGGGKTRQEAENRITNKTGVTADSTASNGSYAYISGGGGNLSMSTNNQSYTYYVNTSGTYYIYARVRGNNHAAGVRMQMYGSDGSSPYYEQHLTGSDNEWTTIGPLKMTLDGSKNYNLSFWRLGGETTDKLQVDQIEFIKDNYFTALPRVGNYMTVGADDAYNRFTNGYVNIWRVLEVPQPPKATSLYVKLADARETAVNKETLNVTLGSNLTTTLGATIDNWTIGGKRVLMTWYYPYREKDVLAQAGWQSKITADLQAIVATGYNVVLLQLFPQWFINFPTDPNNNAVYYTLMECRRLGIKILPSIYYINQPSYLMAKTGINFRTDGASSGSSPVVADATDPQFSAALSNWYDQLYTSFSDIYYTNAAGQKPVMYAEEHGYGFPQGSPYNSRFAPDNIESMRQFRDWLAAKYGTPAALNAAWGYGSSYPAFGTNDTFPNMMQIEIINNVITLQPKDYPAKWKEGTTALADFDAYRSYSLKVRWLDTRSRILANHPQTLFGAYTFGAYGLEDVDGSYYNYTIQRSGVLADDLSQYVDFVNTFYSTAKEVETVTSFWHNKNVDLIAFIRTDGQVTEIFGSSPQTLADGSHSDIPGLNGIAYMNTYPLYPALKQAAKSGAIPAVYTWNDYPLWNINTASVREVVGIFKTNVIP